MERDSAELLDSVNSCQTAVPMANPFNVKNSLLGFQPFLLQRGLWDLLGNRPTISLKLTLTENGLGECSPNVSAHSSKLAPSSHSQIFDGIAF